MIRSGKLNKQSPLKWVSLFVREHYPESPKLPNLITASALRWANHSHFDGNSFLYSTEAHLIKWVSHISLKNQIRPSKISFLSGIRGFCTNKSPRNRQASGKIPRVLTEARAALLEYLHGTRGLHFTDAEHMSKSSPMFLNKLMNRVENEEDIARALRRFFLYHPINEFEPFFESLGLKPSEFNSLLPRDLMFLSDDQELLENYHVLCNYGIARRKIGKMYREAPEIFRYKPGMLGLKLQAYEKLSLSKSSIIKIVASVPSLLVGDVSREFLKVLQELEGMGMERDWIGGVLSEKYLYDWDRMLMTMQFFIEMGFNKKQSGTLIRQRPDFLLDGSGKTVLSMVVLLLKLGGTRLEMVSLLSQFPNVQIGCFRRNLLQGLLLLIEIEMEPEDIQKLLRTHTEVFGSISVKKANSILTTLNVGKKRLCRIIKENPHQLEKYAFGMKIDPLPSSGEAERQVLEKKKFLSRLGFADDSKEMNKALTVFRGKGDELQDRYDFLVNTGLNPNDVSNMIKMAPHILNQKIDVLETKIDFLVNNLGYPLSSLVAFPSYMSYTCERVRLRFLMYKWLIDREKASPTLALSSILACSDKVFTQKFISRHPQGPEVWEKFKKGLSSS